MFTHEHQDGNPDIAVIERIPVDGEGTKPKDLRFLPGRKGLLKISKTPNGQLS